MRPYDVTSLAAEAEASLDVGATLTVRCSAFKGSTFMGVFDIVSGSIDYDETSATRGRCSLKVQRDEHADPDAFDPTTIDVDAWRIQIDVGVVMREGTPYVTVGTFVVWDVERDEDSSEVMTIAGMDVTALVSQARMENVYAVAAGTNYATAIQDILTPTGLDVSIPTTGYTTPLITFEEGSDRLANARSMADSLGWEILATPLGTLQVRVIPAPIGSPVVSYVEGDGCQMKALNKKRTRDQVYNIAIVEGQATGAAAAVRGVAYDDDPRSPTYVTATGTFGFGRVPVFAKSQFVVTTNQATDAAVGLLRSKRGIGSQLRIKTVRPNFRVEPSDLALVVRAKLGVNTVVPVRSVSMNLDPNSFDTTIVTREVFS